MSTAPFLLMILLMSYVLCLMMNSWILIWFMLEMNTLSFCSLTKTFTMKKKGSSEASMKYFIIQSVASGILVFTVLTVKTSMTLLYSLFLVSLMTLMIKMGASPFHQWFINILKKLLWKSGTILMTWQKMAPVYLIIYQMKLFLAPFVWLSCLVGAVSQLNKKKTMEILGFSSIFNLSWMILALILNTWVFLIFCLIYWMAVYSVMFILKEMKKESMDSENISQMKKWLLLIVMINLGGIPPMVGFISKWLVFTEMLKYENLVLIIFILIMSSLNLYVYLRMMNNYMTSSSLKLPKSSNNSSNYVKSLIILMNSLPFIVFIY